MPLAVRFFLILESKSGYGPLFDSRIRKNGILRRETGKDDHVGTNVDSEGEKQQQQT